MYQWFSEAISASLAAAFLMASTWLPQEAILCAYLKHPAQESMFSAVEVCAEMHLGNTQATLGGNLVRRKLTIPQLSALYDCPVQPVAVY